MYLSTKKKTQICIQPPSKLPCRFVCGDVCVSACHFTNHGHTCYWVITLAVPGGFLSFCGPIMNCGALKTCHDSTNGTTSKLRTFNLEPRVRIVYVVFLRILGFQGSTRCSINMLGRFLIFQVKLFSKKSKTLCEAPFCPSQSVISSRHSEKCSRKFGVVRGNLDSVCNLTTSVSVGIDLHALFFLFLPRFPLRC